MTVQGIEERPELAHDGDGLEVVVPFKALRAAVSDLRPAVGRRAGLPALSGVLVRVDGERVTLTATDLEVTVSRPVPGANVRRTGAGFVLPFTALDRFAKVAATSVEVTTDGGEVVLRAGRRALRIEALPVDDFPRIELAGAYVGQADAAPLASALARVSIAASRDETWPILTGVVMEPADGRLDVTATDSYRLATCHLPATTQAGDALLVPYRLAQIVGKQGADAQTLTITATPHQVTFSAPDGRTWSARRIEGEYPNWRQLMPDAEPVLRYGAADMAEALRACKTLGDVSHVTLDLSAERVDVRCKAQGFGRYAERIPSARFTGEALSVGLEPGRLGDAAAVLESAEISAVVLDALKPVLFSGGNGARYLLMPYRTNQPEEN